MCKRYKKLVVLLLAVNLMAVIGGCAKQEEDKTEDVATETPAEDNAEEAEGNTEIASSAKDEEKNTVTNETSDMPATENPDASEDEEPAETMEVQDNIDIKINENEEGAW